MEKFIEAVSCYEYDYSKSRYNNPQDITETLDWHLEEAVNNGEISESDDRYWELLDRAEDIVQKYWSS